MIKDIYYNYKGKNLSRIILDVENQILQIMINYFTSNYLCYLC